MHSLGSFKNCHCLFNWHRLFVKTLAYKGIKDIGSCHNSCAQRNFFSFKTVWISASIPFFVVTVSHLFCNFVKGSVFNLRKIFKKLLPLFRVNLHQLIFFGRKLSDFIKDTLRNMNLSDIMKKSGCRIKLYIFIRQFLLVVAALLQFFCNNFYIFTGMHNMAAGKQIVAAKNLRNKLNDFILGIL